jgi:hypothetical protein
MQMEEKSHSSTIPRLRTVSDILTEGDPEDDEVAVDRTGLPAVILRRFRLAGILSGARQT